MIPLSPLESRQTSFSTRCAVAKNQQSEVELERRNRSDRRQREERRKQNVSVAAERRGQGERRVKVQRRRQIDPTTCERDYSDDEVEFMQALDAYKRTSGRMFPTCSEILANHRRSFLALEQSTPYRQSWPGRSGTYWRHVSLDEKK